MLLDKKQASEKYPGVFFDGEGKYIISSNAIIRHGAVIGYDVRIRSGVVIVSGARIGSGVVIGDSSRIGTGTCIEPGAIIQSNAYVYSDATIGSNAIIRHGAVIGSGRKGVKNTMVLSGLGATKKMTAHDSDDGLVIVIGCLNDYKGASLGEAKIAISKKYPKSHPYFYALKLARAWYESL